MLKGKPGEIAQIRELVDKLDIPTEKTGKTGRLRFVPLQYADAVKTAELLKNLISDTGATSGTENKGQQGPIKTNIQADEELNALLVNAEPDVMAEINGILTNLDVPRAQVLVEAIIVEIRV